MDATLPQVEAHVQGGTRQDGREGGREDGERRQECGGGGQEAPVLPRQLRQDEVRRVHPQRMVHRIRRRRERVQVRRPAAPRPVGDALVAHGRGGAAADKGALQVGAARRVPQLARQGPGAGRL